MLLCEKNSVSDLGPIDVNQIKYNEPSVNDMWRLDILDELIDAKHGDLDIPGFTAGELEDLQEIICTT